VKRKGKNEDPPKAGRRKGGRFSPCRQATGWGGAKTRGINPKKSQEKPNPAGPKMWLDAKGGIKKRGIYRKRDKITREERANEKGEKKSQNINKKDKK